jgi:hypothetical protein
MDLQKVGYQGMDWIDLSQDRAGGELRIGQVESTCECNNEPSGSIKCREFLD